MSLTEKAREVIQDVKEIKTAQATINNQLENIRRDNNHLYGDMSYVREKIGQQQIIVDKVLCNVNDILYDHSLFTYFFLYLYHQFNTLL